MSTTIEWADAGQALTFLTGNEEAADGNTPNGDGHPNENMVAIVVDGCAIYGTPGELLELLSDGVGKVSTHLAGQS